MGVQTIHAEAGTPRLDAGWALLPAESPLPMPEQTLREGALKVRRHRTSPRPATTPAAAPCWARRPRGRR
ncbi:hypothetical protein, partial [Stenotrophomonas maltophilia]|uniref:hypothetical protein n=1 Tax=Stenotrophomonas maltophilia TaxID=40324 RepID=UPI0011B484D9